ncbi:HTH domain-containing protein [Tamaricihabitans halophyticus]|uniref:HTH domain-containing protein n=1 Tax=Tamaricihabitans halophyticus TaxID=1262583 RepID=A0A4R2QXF7_9PSEU|nr:HTH domain-containing protein [Tamaricihabitans halophyticus]TCP54004.1 HTH domain-containing protein [Tamaricihabitans halophyticus]
MNPPTIGVVGPSDLVAQLAEIVRNSGKCPVVPIAYQHENETVGLLREHHDAVDAWLFTGIVPHTIARAAAAVEHPAEHVSYSGVTLLSIVVRLLSEGRAVRALSVDTLGADEVRETLDAAGLADTATEVFEYREGQTNAELLAFHRAARKRLGPDAIALTCLGSAFHALHDELPSVRMVPSIRDTREAVASLLLKTQSHRYSDAQVAVGFAELDEARVSLAPLLSRLGASSFELDDGRLAFVTTRGPLSAATAEFSCLPLLAGLTAPAHIGMGVGRSAAEAEALAQAALGRAQEADQVAGAVALPNDVPRILDSAPEAEVGTRDLRQLATRAGVSKQTLLTLRSMLADRRSGEVTAQDIAEAFGVHERSARRLVKQLERAGIAVPSGRRINGPGRPLVVYDFKL